MKTKAWWRSWTLWVNLVAAVALLAQKEFGFALDGGTQAAILTVINFLLRLITKEPVGFSDQPAPGPFSGIDAGGPGMVG